MLHNPTSWAVTAIAWSKRFASAECARITDLQESVTTSEFGAFETCRWALRMSFDHLISEREQCCRQHEAERLRGPEIDYQLEFGRLHHREVGRRGALEDAACVDACLTIHLPEIGPIAH